MTASLAPAARPVTLAHLAQLLFLGAVWGGAFLFLRIASPEVGAVWTAEIRIVIGAVILLAIFGRRTLPLVRTNLRAFAIAGAAFSAIPFTLIAIAVQTLPVGFGAIINASTPLFTAMLAVVWLGERLSVRMLVGLVIGVAAVVVLVGWSPLEANLATLVAVLAALGAALGYAFAGHVREAATPRGGRHGTGDRPARGRCHPPAPVRDRVRDARHALTDRRRGAPRGRDVVDGPPLADLHATPALDHPDHRELRHVRRARVRDHVGRARAGRVGRAVARSSASA